MGIKQHRKREDTLNEWKGDCCRVTSEALTVAMTAGEGGRTGDETGTRKAKGGNMGKRKGGKN